MNKQQQGYKVIEATIVEDVAKTVLGYQAEGWVAIGGLERSNGFFQQVMVLPLPEKKIKEFTVVEVSDLEMFTKEIISMMTAGWSLHGGLAVAPYKQELRRETIESITYIQAMVKYE